MINKYKYIKIVILTAYKLEFYIRRAKKIGCKGFISKEEETNKLIQNIKSIVEDDKLVFPEENPMLEALTEREMSIDG